MKSDYLIIQLIDNEIILVQKDNVIKQKLNDSVAFGKIIKPKSFIKKFSKMQSSKKILKNILKPYIIFIINPTYCEADIEVVKRVLEDSGYSKYKIINELKYYKLKHNNMWITVNNTYLYITYLEYNKKVGSLNLEYRLFSNKQNKIIKHLKNIIKKRHVILLGYKDNLYTIAQKIETKSNIKSFIIENPSTYVIDQIKNTFV